MAEPQAATPINKPSMQLGDIMIEGKINEVSRPENSEFRYYNFQLGAADQYSQPALVQVSQPKNDQPFASKGDVIRIKCKIGGYGRRSNGNLFVTNTLNYVESY